MDKMLDKFAQKAVSASSDDSSLETAEIVAMDFFLMTLNSMTLWMDIVSDAPLPDSFMLDCTGEDRRKGLISKNKPTFKISGPHKIRKAEDYHVGKNKPVVIKLNDGRYKSKYVLEIGYKEFRTDIKVGTHEVTLTISGGILKNAYMFNKEYKAGMSDISW